MVLHMLEANGPPEIPKSSPPKPCPREGSALPYRRAAVLIKIEVRYVVVEFVTLTAIGFRSDRGCAYQTCEHPRSCNYDQSRRFRFTGTAVRRSRRTLDVGDLLPSCNTIAQSLADRGAASWFGAR